jgi:hypothetical protein
MTAQKPLIKRLDFSLLPNDWRLLNVSVDWQGEPLLLFEQGRPKQPIWNGNWEEMSAWLNTRAQSHHLLYYSGSHFAEIAFQASEMAPHHVQPFGDGWLLGEVRGGNTQIFDRTMNHIVRTLDLGDASNQIQTTENGQIWVSYFDEGVFGNGIGKEGLVCFDSEGRANFKYAEFADKFNLPSIDDCYALNVDKNEVWVCYYSDFPLVHLKDFALAGLWKDWASTSALAIRDQLIVYLPAYKNAHLVARTLNSDTETNWELITPERESLSSQAEKFNKEEDVGFRRSFSCTGRGKRFYVWTNSALYELP